MDLKKHIRSIPDYPKKGILFRDITTLIKNPEAFKFTNDKIIEIAKKMQFDKVAAVSTASVLSPIGAPVGRFPKKSATLSFLLIGVPVGSSTT